LHHEGIEKIIPKIKEGIRNIKTKIINREQRNRKIGMDSKTKIGG
jgi:hypothetical protein